MDGSTISLNIMSSGLIQSGIIIKSPVHPFRSAVKKGLKTPRTSLRPLPPWGNTAMNHSGGRRRNLTTVGFLGGGSFNSQRAKPTKEPRSSANDPIQANDRVDANDRSLISFAGFPLQSLSDRVD
uniref:Uncharacterized protein n=1 Tax=Nelumbo nucifera TaxID=4432 RepID=A0A822Y699_NELNU|nr:TPA_asm: hypothetical protein HUJ06_029021 [Nelumbo nucifera]